MDKAPELSKLTWLELAALCEGLYKENRELERKAAKAIDELHSVGWLRQDMMGLSSLAEHLEEVAGRLRTVAELSSYVQEGDEEEAVDNRK
jgi:hypothetical protein